MKTVFRTDFITLAAEDALSHPYPDAFGIWQKFDCIGRTDSYADFTSDAGISVVCDLPSEFRRRLHGRDYHCFSIGYSLQI